MRVTPLCLYLIAGLLPGASLAAQPIDTVWTIRGGTFDRLAVPVARGAAHQRGSRFWRMTSRHGERRVVGWNPTRLPAAVAFRPGRGIGPADSSAFWSILRNMESDAGVRLFEPITLEADADPADVIVVDVKPMGSGDGLTLVTWSSQGAVFDARVHVRSPDLLRDPRVVTHEMMHALGFGHTLAWPSVMSPRLHAASRLTPSDVAYLQLALASRAAHERSDLWELLALAAEREPVPPAGSAPGELCFASPGDPLFRFPGACTYDRGSRP